MNFNIHNHQLNLYSNNTYTYTYVWHYIGSGCYYMIKYIFSRMEKSDIYSIRIRTCYNTFIVFPPDIHVLYYII